MSTNRRSFTRILFRFCMPLGVICLVLAIAVSRQSIRFRLTESTLRLDGTYQIVLQANAILDRSKKPDIVLEPFIATDVLVIGNRVTVVTKQPLQSGQRYSLNITNAYTMQGQRQNRVSAHQLTTASAIAYGIKRTGTSDSIEKITITDGQPVTQTLYSGERISHMAVSPDVIWFATWQDDRTHTLYSYDKLSAHIQTYGIPANVMLDTLHASRQTNAAIITVSSNQQVNGQPLQYENSVFTLDANAASVTASPPPMDSAALALFSPDGSLYVTQARDGSIYARGLADGEATPLGRTRLIGPFTGDSRKLLLRNLSVATLVTLGATDQSSLQFIPDTASQVQIAYAGDATLYSITEFDTAGSGKARIYQSNPTSTTPRLVYELPEATYSGRLAAQTSLQYASIELFPTGAQFDGYLQNAKASGTQSVILNIDGTVVGTVPIVDILWD